MEYIEAVRYSACCMSTYAVARVVSPLYAARDRVFLLFGGTLAVEGLAYALTPTVVRLPRARAFYTAFRVLGGTCFAILKANTAVLLVRVFGVDMVAPVSGLFLAFEVVSGFGPMIAFTIHDRAVGAGARTEHSYDGLFYLCAALVEAGALCVLVLRRHSGEPRDDATPSETSAEPRAGDPPAVEEARVEVELTVTPSGRRDPGGGGRLCVES